MKKIYIIGIGWIWISGIARYYHQYWYQVFGSDQTQTELTKSLQKEWIDVYIGERSEIIDETFETVIYTEAIPSHQSEFQKAKQLWLTLQTYPKSLAEIANQKKLITIAGTHGKSTTTSMISLLLKNSKLWVNALIWSVLQEFDDKNVFFSESEYFVLEACEYKRSFLNYKPFIAVITNIDLDHLDYYKDLGDYISAFESYTNNIISGWYLILNAHEKNSQKLIGMRDNIHYILVNENNFTFWNHIYDFPTFKLKIPGKHIEFDAKLAFVVWKILWLWDEESKTSLEAYNGIWRRSEIIGITENGNILMSDYGHHPTEISLNLWALKQKYNNKKIITVFQPHQYNRTLELLEDFKNCFTDTDILIVPDIYESRDTEADKAKINGEKFVNYINHPHKIFGNGLQNTLKLIQEFDKKYPGELVIILQWAGNVDDLRYEIEIKKI